MEKNMSERDFKGVWIPKEVWLNKKLSPLDKILLIEIDSLDNDDGCFKSNKSFAEFMQCGVNTITRSIKKLTDLGLISCRMKAHEKGNLRVIKMVRGVTPKQLEGPHQNGEQGNTIRGNTKEDKKTKAKKGTDYPFELFWAMYDKKTSKTQCEKKYEKISEADRALIFEHVLKYKESQPDKQYRKNPETYLNQKSWNDEIIKRNQAQPVKDDSELGEIEKGQKKHFDEKGIY